MAPVMVVVTVMLVMVVVMVDSILFRRKHEMLQSISATFFPFSRFIILTYLSLHQLTPSSVDDVH